ncbi:hypothetical protein F750_5004 [Streptomyces sp. PAMC 26508]|nr:hypothetical protein F750_5004 [Streptomyces sp. PAMC 26508]
MRRPRDRRGYFGVLVGPVITGPREGSGSWSAGLSVRRRSPWARSGWAVCR